MATDWEAIRINTEKSEKLIRGLPTNKLERIHQFISLFLKLRAAEKLKSTYIKGCQKALEYNEDNKIYCDFKLDGTVTGRMSCAGYKAGKGKKKGVSFHTLPRQDDEINIRKLYVAPKGWCFITADFSMQELRALSVIANEGTMQEAFNKGLDLHAFSGSLVFNKPMDKVKPEERQASKETSFLIVYGGTPATLSGKINKSVPQAKKIMDAWYRAYPGIKEYQDYPV